MKRNLKAFSLIELSIVILIIGVLITGVTQGSTLIKKANLSRAKDLTIRSEVGNIKNLAVWLETSLPDSVTVDSNGKVTKWNDINPNRPGGVNAVATNSSTAPAYLTDMINGLPVISFTGSSSQFLWWGTTSGDGLNLLVKSNYTIFVVEKRAYTGTNLFMGGSSSNEYSNMHLGYRDNTVITHDRYFDGVDCTVASFGGSNRAPAIHTFLFTSSTITLTSGSTVVGSGYLMNGGAKASCYDSSKVNALVDYPGATIGRYMGTIYYTGNFAEIIIYTRYLKASERGAVESYLSKKYAIPVKPA